MNLSFKRRSENKLFVLTWHEMEIIHEHYHIHIFTLKLFVGHSRDLLLFFHRHASFDVCRSLPVFPFFLLKTTKPVVTFCVWSSYDKSCLSYEIHDFTIAGYSLAGANLQKKAEFSKSSSSYAADDNKLNFYFPSECKSFGYIM